MKLKVGDKVICKENGIITLGGNIFTVDAIWLGRIGRHTIARIGGIDYCLEGEKSNDHDEATYCDRSTCELPLFKEHFISLKELRKKKLNEIEGR